MSDIYTDVHTLVLGALLYSQSNDLSEDMMWNEYAEVIHVKAAAASRVNRQRN